MRQCHVQPSFSQKVQHGRLGVRRPRKLETSQTVFWKEDAEEMIEWRSMSQKEMDQCWKELAGQLGKEVLEKYKVEDSKRGAYRSRGSPLKWRRVRRSRKYRIRKWGEDCWATIFASFREYSLQRLQKHAPRFDGGRRDDAAAKNEGCERYNEEN